MKQSTQGYDVSREAQSEGIPLPVVIDGPLMETLTPSPYLESLGISCEQRIVNLLRLTKALLNPQEEFGASSDAVIPVPLMVLRGPLVREDCHTITLRIDRDIEGKKTITISQVVESNE
jgi:hypothetical protein